MSGRALVASSPSRIDLAGGTLDIWPLSMLVPGAMTVNLAIELRAEVRVAPRRDRKLRIVSRDRRKQATFRLPIDPARLTGPLSLLARLTAGFAPTSGLELSAHATAPAGAGLGGSSTLAIAAGAALNRFVGSGLGRPALLRRVMNLETVELGVPTGNQDYLAAIHGGLAAYHHEPDGTRREPIAPPEGLAERLVLAYTGQPRHSGFSNWEMYRRFIDGERTTVRRFERIAGIAGAMREALAQADLDRVGRLIGEEGRLRGRLAPSVTTAAIDRAQRAARSAGALGSKVCGAGGGGCLVAFARAGRSERVAAAMAETGAVILDCRLARRGLRVSSPRAGS